MPETNPIAPDDIIEKELNSIYKNLFSRRRFRKKINRSYDKAFDNNRTLNVVVSLLSACTIGIYVIIAMLVTYWYFHS